MDARFVGIMCRNCNTTQKYAQIKLAGYYGRNVSIPCRQCGVIQKIEVNAKLLDLAQNETNLFETKIIENRQLKVVISRMATIEVLQNADTSRQTIELLEGENIIGRKSQDQYQNKREIVTNDKLMSRSHCKITVQEKDNYYKYILSDFTSRSGTFLNNEKIGEEDEVFINTNDLIRLGSTVIKLKL